MRYVLDASALLAILLDEPGSEVVFDMLGSACIGTANLAEVATVLARRGGTPEEVRAALDCITLMVVPLHRNIATVAGTLWPATKSAGAPLGDRCALALAQTLVATLITADTALAEIAPAVGVETRSFRQRSGAG